MYHVRMKTISLSDEAYQRLKSWKTGETDSFSKVVLKTVPKRGTAADMLQAAEALPSLTDDHLSDLEAAHEWSNQWPEADPS